MAQSIIDEIGQILPPSRNLAETLARAADYATQQSHLEVTLEHLLLALTEDPDAARVLAVSAVEIDRLKGDISSHLGRLEDRSATGGAAGISADLRQILEASAAAARGRREAIDGAIVLAAIVGDGRSTAAHMLRAHGLTFDDAIKALQSAVQGEPEPAAPEQAEHVAPSPPAEAIADGSAPAAAAASAPQPLPYHPPGTSADEILASARQRVEGRIGLAPSEQGTHAKTGQYDEDEALAAAENAADEDFDRAARQVSMEPPLDQSAKPSSDVSDADEAGSCLSPQESEVPTAGPRPAPRSKRPRPPGALREQTTQGVEAGDEQIAAAAVKAKVARPEPANDHGRAQVAKETAIDQVLASIRKSGKSEPAHTDALPTPGQVAAPLPPAPQRPSALSRAPTPALLKRPAGNVPPRPSDGDYFGPSVRGHGQPRADATAPSVPPPGRAAGSARAPILGLQPFRGTPQPGTAAPPPPRATRQHQHARPDQPGKPPLSGPRPAAAVPDADGAAQRGAAQRQRPSDLSIGQMVQNIPHTMRVGIPIVIEARIARAEVKALADGLQGGGAVWRHELTVTKAMSVRLRAPDGGFFIETASPETQWIENTLGVITDDYASWRWSVTPKERGAKRLQLVISARTVGTDGLAAETALPDQIVTVKVRVNYARTAKKVGGWVLAAVIGGVLARFGGDLPATVASLMSTLVK